MISAVAKHVHPPDIPIEAKDQQMQAEDPRAIGLFFTLFGKGIEMAPFVDFDEINAQETDPVQGSRYKGKEPSDKPVPEFGRVPVTCRKQARQLVIRYRNPARQLFEAASARIDHLNHQQPAKDEVVVVAKARTQGFKPSTNAVGYADERKHGKFFSGLLVVLWVW